MSTLPRAIETAEIVFPDADITRGDAYCEMVPGECDGMPREEARNRYAPEVDGPDEPMSPGGESQRQFNARVAAAVDDLAACHDGREVVVVTHGGFVWGTLHHMFGEMNIAAPANASLTVVRRDGNHGWQLERYNDHAHLFS